ncbi:MAG: hypothetical protein ACLVAT_12540 [Lachnospiraceae bacterium]
MNQTLCRPIRRWRHIAAYRLYQQGINLFDFRPPPTPLSMWHRQIMAVYLPQMPVRKLTCMWEQMSGN